jgi:HEAT repeat protein
VIQDLDMNDELAEDRIHRFQRAYQENEASELRHAIMDLEENDASEVVPVLMALLGSPDNSIRGCAVYMLGKIAPIGDPKIGAKIVPLLKDSDDLIRAETAEALGLLEYGQASPDLILTLQSDPDELVRVCAAESLGYIFHHAPTPICEALIQALQDRDGLVRGYAADSLTHAEPARVLAPIQERLDGENYPYYRAWLLQAMIQLGEHQKIPELLDTLRIKQADYEVEELHWSMLFTIMQGSLRKIVTSKNISHISAHLARIGQDLPFLSESMEVLISRLPGYLPQQNHE